ncbi:hypothetical protein B0A48_11558 [Cryoendolithus antarcticus]|uniref:NADH dehydrogenase [ubiquinone] iron-sulfur protein 5 n=1 Tax=Cryoendolithus antarcticus TaxID=1507870 RepID=A0A1V8SWN6_9PEZI|nr:hypothetical protein B0A48_11558 [Cryoendolithus antarcticus]OQO16138.1 hypothetical protein B0A51_14048 [Rachicladosporium sp. CCFEE 5018]OQO22449.1 hypothetical protein B0A51_06247 [Rachicladosporium sp. CCFEE 5018]
MSSGYGLTGGPSRCFPFWQEVLACYVVNTSAENDSGKSKCAPVLEDYYECLHHRKEAAKVTALQAAYRRREAETSRDALPTAGEIRSLGLLKRDGGDESVGIKTPALLPRYESNVAARSGERS